MTTINGRPPEEIKHILECCYGNKEKRLCDRCPMGCKVEGYSEFICLDFDDAGENALALIQQLERERDAAVKDIVRTCLKCAHREHKFLADGKLDDLCGTCLYNNMCNWQWRGEPLEVKHGTD